MSLLISVVIPTHNRRNHIKRCLDALLHQDYSLEMLEIIVVDDGSSDRTCQVLESYAGKSPCVRYMRQDHSGHGVARNLGFSKARGDIVVSLDDDCVVCDGWLREIENFFANHPHVSICCGRIDNATDHPIAWAQHMIDYSLWIGRRFRMGIFFMPTANVAYRKDALKSAALRKDGKDLGYRDIIFNHELVQKGALAAYNPKMFVRHERWEFVPEDDLLKIFLAGQKRHGRGLRCLGCDIYAQAGALLVRAPLWLLVAVKTGLIGFRAASAGFFRQYVRSFAFIRKGICAQLTAFKRG